MDSFDLEIWHMITGIIITILTMRWMWRREKTSIIDEAQQQQKLSDGIQENKEHIVRVENRVEDNRTNLNEKIDELRKENSDQHLSFRKEVNEKFEKIDGKLDTIRDTITQYFANK